MKLHPTQTIISFAKDNMHVHVSSVDIIHLMIKVAATVVAITSVCVCECHLWMSFIQ